jgi:hypothetical protein
MMSGSVTGLALRDFTSEGFTPEVTNLTRTSPARGSSTKTFVIGISLFAATRTGTFISSSMQDSPKFKRLLVTANLFGKRIQVTGA